MGLDQAAAESRGYQSLECVPGAAGSDRITKHIAKLSLKLYGLKRVRLADMPHV